MKSFNRLKVLFVLLLCALPFTQVIAQSPVTISVWIDTIGGQEANDCYIAQMRDVFNALDPNLQVEVQLQPNLWDVTRTAIAGGAGPDVVITPGPTFQAQMAAAGFLAPLDAYVEQYGWAERFAPWALDLGRTDGVLYSIPDQVETLVLYYNETLFEENGWAVPTTIDELRTLSETISAAGIIPFAHANAEWRPANEWFVGVFMNNVAGPQAVYEALSNQRSWSDPAFVTAIDALNQYQQEGSFMGGLDRYYTTTFGEASAAFSQGNAAMKIEGTWYVGEANNFFNAETGTTNQWNWAPIPTTDGNPVYSLGVGGTVSINNASLHKDEVARYLDYQFSEETQARLISLCESPPAPISIDPALLSTIDPRQAGIITALNDATAAGGYGYTTWTFFPPDTETYLIEQIESVWAGNITTAQFLEGFQSTFDAEFAAGVVPVLPARGS